MSKFDVNIEDIKRECIELNSEKDGLYQLSNAIASVDLMGISGNSQLSMLQGSIDALKTKVKMDVKEMSAVGDTLGRITVLYENSESKIVSGLSAMANPDGAVAGAAAGLGVIGVQNVEGLKSEIDEITDLDDALSILFPNRGAKKLAKTALKKALKEIKPGSEKMIDISDIVNKLEKGDIFGALEKTPGLFDVKTWDFKKLKNMPKGTNDFGGVMNTGALKFQAVMKTLKMVTDSDGYISRYQDRYESEGMEYLKSGNIIGAVYSLSSEFIQTVGKGSVDVTCQLISSGLDSAVKTLTFGLVDVSTINAALEDTIGFSPGTMFNATTRFISDGVDYVLDDLIPGAADVVSNITGKAVNAGGKIISSGINFVKKLF